MVTQCRRSCSRKIRVGSQMGWGEEGGRRCTGVHFSRQIFTVCEDTRTQSLLSQPQGLSGVKKDVRPNSMHPYTLWLLLSNTVVVICSLDRIRMKLQRRHQTTTKEHTKRIPSKPVHTCADEKEQGWKFYNDVGYKMAGMLEVTHCILLFCFLCIFEVKPKRKLLHPIVPTPQKNRIEVSGEEGPTVADKTIDILPTDDSECPPHNVVPGEYLYMHSPSVLKFENVWKMFVSCTQCQFFFYHSMLSEVTLLPNTMFTTRGSSDDTCPGDGSCTPRNQPFTRDLFAKLPV